MAKGQKRSSKEIRKPKAAKAKAEPAAASGADRNPLGEWAKR